MLLKSTFPSKTIRSGVLAAPASPARPAAATVRASVAIIRFVMLVSQWSSVAFHFRVAALVRVHDAMTGGGYRRRVTMLFRSSIIGVTQPRRPQTRHRALIS